MPFMIGVISTVDTFNFNKWLEDESNRYLKIYKSPPYVCDGTNVKAKGNVRINLEEIIKNDINNTK